MENRKDEPLKLRFPEEVTQLMQGAVDFHCHAGPSIIPRKIDGVGAARQGEKAGLSAVVVKDHHLPTARDVQYAREYVLKKEGLKIDLIGGIALNQTVGGINPYAVEVALYLGARVVYLPTVSSRSHHEHHKKEVAGAHFPATAKKFLEPEPLYLLDEKGRLPAEARIIMEQVRDADAVLTMGHLSVPEILAALDMARDVGVRRLVVHHPNFIIEAKDEEIVEFARRGAMIEFSACMSDPRCKFYFIPAQELGRLIGLIGVESVFVGSDLGQHDTPPFVEGMMAVADDLMETGIKMEELKKLFRENPKKLLY